MPRTFLLALSFSFAVCLQASGKDFTKPDDVLDGVSKEVLKELRQWKKGTPFPADVVKQADEQMQNHCKGKTGTFRFVVDSVETNEQGTIELSSKAVNERAQGMIMSVTYIVLLAAEEKEKASRIKPGDRIVATGTPWGALTGSSTGVFRLSFCLDKAVLK